MEPDSNWLSMEKVQKEMEFFRLYRALHNMMREGIEQGLRQMGVDLTSSQLDVLICIAQGGGRPVNQKDIEEELFGEKVSPLLIQNFMENSIKYAKAKAIYNNFGRFAEEEPDPALLLSSSFEAKG